MSIHTDEIAISVLSDAASNDWRRAEAHAHIAARLRGETAQGEQQAVAWVRIDPNGKIDWAEDCLAPEPRDLLCGLEGESYTVAPLYTRPQPGVAGDAVRALRDLRHAYVKLLESGRDRIMDLGGSCDPVDVMERGDFDLRKADVAIAALSAAPAAPVTDSDWMAHPQTIEAKRQWNTVADILRAGRDDPDSVIAAAEVAARALHGVERLRLSAPAPVAGDAVARLPDGWQELVRVGSRMSNLCWNVASGFKAGTGEPAFPEDYRQSANELRSEWDAARKKVAALAQGCASQITDDAASARRVPRRE